MKHLGIILLVLGSLLLALPMLLPDVMGDLVDQNPYTIGAVCLIFAGVVAHVIVKKIDLKRN